jgi:hypothetical protein
MSPVLPAGLAVALILFLISRAKAAQGSAGELEPAQPASGLHGEPRASVEQAGTHTYEVLTWPAQPDGAVYRFVKMKDAPGQHGVLFSERMVSGQAVRSLEQSSGPASVVETIRGEWIIGD